jgi:predicted aspartyl protease
MKGRVDKSGRAIIEVKIAACAEGPLHSIDAWIDTGFTGDLVISRK